MQRTTMMMVRVVMVAALAIAGGACGGDAGPKAPVKIGLSVSLTGSDMVFGNLALQSVQLGVEQINAKGGIDGHPIELIFYDDQNDEVVAGQKVQQLVQQDHVVAVVGPFFSGAVANALEFVKAGEVPLVSPSSTAPFLANADDGGYVFRDVPNDDFQGLAMAHYLLEVAAPPVMTVAIVAEDSDYGLGLATAFTTAFVAKGGTVAGAPITFPPNLDPLTNQAELDAVVSGLVTANAPTTILIALANDGNLIVKQWDASGMVPALTWFGTDGVRSAAFLEGLPAKMVGSLGTAPTYPSTGDAFTEFSAAFNARFGQDISQTAYLANTYDAIYLLGAALLQQNKAFPGDPFGGPNLRDALTAVSREPGVILRASQWTDISSAIGSGGDVDYDGASGPCDFDPNGEALGPYEVWRIKDDGAGGLTFEQALYLEARDIGQ